jgi:hypothetical protein
LRAESSGLLSLLRRIAYFAGLFVGFPAFNRVTKPLLGGARRAGYVQARVALLDRFGDARSGREGWLYFPE